MRSILHFFFCLAPFILQGLPPSIAIFTGTTNDREDHRWDPDIIKTGITGSEEAVIYISQKLANLGYRVVVYGDIPEGSRYFSPDANPRYVPSDFLQLDTPFDIGIAWRQPETGKNLKKFAKKGYFWPHDPPDQQIEPSLIEAFDGVLWLSRSQREEWIKINPAFGQFTYIFGNGINPEQFGPIQERKNPYSCIYASCYRRGLALLLDLWPKVKKHYPLATLDIYYGWRKSALTSPIEKFGLEAKIRSLEFLGVKEHGLVGHEQLNEAYQKASFWTYPCTSLRMETFCISALRAQFSGAIPVIISGSALKETVPHGFQCDEAKDYLNTLLYAMSQAEKISLDTRKAQRAFILEKYTWEKIAFLWKQYFEEL